MLEKYAGREDKLFRKLEAKYGETPEVNPQMDDTESLSGSVKSIGSKQLSEFYMKHNPSMVDKVDETLEKYEGREDKLCRKLEAKYGEAPAVDPEKDDTESLSGSVKSIGSKRLSEFYMKHNPSMVDKVDETLEKYEGREDKLCRKL